jgi:hypothetical protein
MQSKGGPTLHDRGSMATGCATVGSGCAQGALRYARGMLERREGVPKVVAKPEESGV